MLYHPGLTHNLWPITCRILLSRIRCRNEVRLQPFPSSGGRTGRSVVWRGCRHHRGALPYLEATSHLNASQLSIIVAAVLLGSVISTLFAGLLADMMGRKLLMMVSGLTFVLSIPIIALADGYSPLFFGRLLQGISGGLIGVVVPLYLAECLPASNRGKGTAVFQWLLTLGIVSAALIGIYYSYRVEAVARVSDAATVFAFKDQAWRANLLGFSAAGSSLVLGSLFVAESPRWLLLRGRQEKALASLLRSREPEQAELELKEMKRVAASKAPTGEVVKGLTAAKEVCDSLHSGLSSFLPAIQEQVSTRSSATTPPFCFKAVSPIFTRTGVTFYSPYINFVMTIFGMTLIDRKGRKFLFILGTSGIIVSLIGIGFLFLGTEKMNQDCRDTVQAMVTPDQTLNLKFTPEEAKRLLDANGKGNSIDSSRASLAVIYSYGDFTSGYKFCTFGRPECGSCRDLAGDCGSFQ